MTQHRYRLIDVFTATRFTGNPLAVFPDAREIPAARMQRIAAELNLSETTFVLPTDAAGCDFRLRIFTPTTELPMAGHPTVGTAWVLDRPERVTFLEGVGSVPVERVALAGGRHLWRMTQPPATWLAGVEDRAVLAAALGLERADVAEAPPPQVVSCGVPFLLVALRDLDALGRARPRLERWSPLAARLGNPGLYCYTLATGESGVGVRSRMFAPEFGVGEDPATGGASGPLGCHLVRHGAVPAGSPARILNVQGVEMGRRSEIHVEVEGDAVRVGGECVAVGWGTLDLGD